MGSGTGCKGGQGRGQAGDLSPSPPWHFFFRRCTIVVFCWWPPGEAFIIITPVKHQARKHALFVRLARPDIDPNGLVLRMYDEYGLGGKLSC